MIIQIMDCNIFHNNYKLNYYKVLQIVSFINMSDVSLDRLINGWSILDKIPTAVLLIGYSNTGRSTLAELIKKYYYKNGTAGLTYEEGKYNLQNIIANKSIKIQTTVPVVYEVNNGNKEDVKILDIPSFCLSPDNKKWTVLEQKITAKFMFEKVQRVGFLLFFEEKTTKTNVAPMRKLLNSFLDLFNGNLSDQIENSIGIIVTKSPDIKQDIIAKRLEVMRRTLTKQKSIDIQTVQKIFNKIFSNNRVFIMKRVTGQVSQEQEIIDLAKRLQTLPNCFIDKNCLKQLAWSLEEEKIIGDYISQSSQLMESLIQTIKLVFSQMNLSAENIKLYIKNSKFQIKNNEIIPNLRIKALLQQNDVKKLNFPNIAKNYFEFKTSMQGLDRGILINKIYPIIVYLIKFQIFSCQDLPLFQTLFEIFDFIKVMDYKEVSLERQLQAIYSLFSQDMHKSILKLLKLEPNSDQNKLFYEKEILP